MKNKSSYKQALKDCLEFKQPFPKFSVTSMAGITTWYTSDSMTQEQINAYFSGWEDYRNAIREKLEELDNDK